MRYAVIHGAGPAKVVQLSEVEFQILNKQAVVLKAGVPGQLVGLLNTISIRRSAIPEDDLVEIRVPEGQKFVPGGKK